jgi:hypothetical protein
MNQLNKLACFWKDIACELVDVANSKTVQCVSCSIQASEIRAEANDLGDAADFLFDRSLGIQGNTCRLDHGSLRNGKAGMLLQLSRLSLNIDLPVF